MHQDSWGRPVGRPFLFNAPYLARNFVAALCATGEARCVSGAGFNNHYPNRDHLSLDATIHEDLARRVLSDGTRSGFLTIPRKALDKLGLDKARAATLTFP